MTVNTNWAHCMFVPRYIAAFEMLHYDNQYAWMKLVWQLLCAFKVNHVQACTIFLVVVSSGYSTARVQGCDSYWHTGAQTIRIPLITCSGMCTCVSGGDGAPTSSVKLLASLSSWSAARAISCALWMTSSVLLRGPWPLDVIKQWKLVSCVMYREDTLMMTGVRTCDRHLQCVFIFGFVHCNITHTRTRTRTRTSTHTHTHTHTDT